MGENSAVYTTLADEQLYNQFSPGRRKNEFALASSSSSSPNLMKASPSRVISSPYSTQKAVTIFDLIANWFHSQINTRKRFASVACSFLASLFFILTVSFLKLSIWAPFSSLQDSLTWWLFPTNWPAIMFSNASSAGLAYIILMLVCKVDQSPRLPVTETSAWVVVLFEFFHRISLVFVSFKFTETSFVTGFPWVAICFGLIVSSLIVVFRTDYQFTFSSIQVNSLSTFVEALKSLPIVSISQTCAFESTIAFVTTILFIVLIGPIFWGFSTWWLLINLNFHILLFGMFFTQQIYSKLCIKVINQIVMKPVSFPFAPPYTVHSPTPEQTRTLPNVIETDDPLLKIFAFHDLRTVAWNDEKRRIEVFSLSQPGKHPRNWKAVSIPCIRMLDELCSKMTVAAARLVGYSWDDHETESEDVPRDALMMPRKMREMTFRRAGPSRQQRSMAPIRTQNTQTGGLVAKISKMFGLGSSEKLVITRYEARLYAYASEAVYMLVVDSLGEDRFGVVQKDLKELLTLLCKLIAAIDTYDRARASVADKSDVTFLRIVDSSLKSSLQRVVTTFGGHLRSLNLADEHIRTIRLVCPIDEL